MPRLDDAISKTRDGVLITVEVSPGSKQNLFPSGFNPWRKTIGCRITAPAREGRANAAIIAVIADFLDLPHEAVEIQSGATSHIKKIHISGMKKEEVIARVAAVAEK